MGYFNWIVIIGFTFYLTDIGYTQWQRAVGIGDRFIYSSIFINDLEIIYAGTDSGAYQSTDRFIPTKRMRYSNSNG
jgi:hypothetical protein